MGDGASAVPHVVRWIAILLSGPDVQDSADLR